MSLLIEDLVAGDSFRIQGDVTGVLATDPLIKAWLTIKEAPSDLDAQAALQKIITTIAVVGVGQITQDGSALNGNGTGSVVFIVTKEESAALGAGTRYYYDIQAKSLSGEIYTAHDAQTGDVVGRFQLLQGVTDASS